MLYDGQCKLCIRAVNKWHKKTGTAVSYKPYQQALSKFPHITKEACEKTVQLITPDGTVYTGAHAVLKAFDLAEKYKILHTLYHTVPLFGRIAEGIYAWTARHRLLVSKFFPGKL